MKYEVPIQFVLITRQLVAIFVYVSKTNPYKTLSSLVEDGKIIL